MPAVSTDRDTFLPRIESAFYATFHEKRGPQIVFQVPEGLISQASSGGGSSTAHASKSTLTSPTRGHTESSSNVASAPTSSVCTTSPSDSSTNILTAECTQNADSPGPLHRTSDSSSVSTLDMALPSSPTAFRSIQQHRHLQSSSTSNSPQKPSSLHLSSVPATILDFSDISRFVIPTQEMCGRLVICATQTHRVIGFPVCLEAQKYQRVHFRYNLCFVFERTADLSCYEPVVRKIARVLMACEEESSFLSDPITAFQIRPILEQLYEDLNSYHETSISIDQFNSIELKLFPFYPNPPKVYDWTVPLALINIMKRIEPNWDLTMTKVCKYIDGINHVSRIANLADCDLELTRQAISHLLYYQCIMTLDIFQYSNIYTLKRSLQWLADDPNVKSECGPYVTKPGYSIPDWPHLLFLYSRLKPGKTVFEWEEEHGVRAQGIDVRRFMSFGYIKGFLRRIHRWPVLIPDKPLGPRYPGLHVEDTLSIGRRRGKSVSHTAQKLERPRSPEAKKERSHSQSQSHTHPSLTEAEAYARSVQLRETSVFITSGGSLHRPRNGTESRRLSIPDPPVLGRPSGTTVLAGTPYPHSKTTPVAEARRPQLRPTEYPTSPCVESLPNPSHPYATDSPPYPPDLPALLDGTHHTDELATRFEAGWPVLDKWLVAIGGGEGTKDYGRVAIIYQ